MISGQCCKQATFLVQVAVVFRLKKGPCEFQNERGSLSATGIFGPMVCGRRFG